MKNQAEAERMLKLYRQGLSLQVIGQRFGVSRETVRRRIAQARRDER